MPLIMGDAIVGAVCTISLLAPGPPVIASADCWSNDAPPGGQPDRIDHIEVSELQATIADEDEPDEAGKEPHANVIAQGTSNGVKCKGKYRIMVKGTARHGCGCCGGT